MKELLGIIKSLIEGFDIKGRWISIVIIVVIAFIFLIAVESITGWNYYSNLERRTELLQELHQLSKDGIKSDPDLSPIYDQTIIYLEEKSVFSPSLPQIKLHPSVRFWKFIAGGSLWFFMASLGPFGIYGKEDRLLSLFVLSIIGSLFGYLGSIIPTLYRPWINYSLYPILQLFLLIIISRRTSKGKAN